MPPAFRFNAKRVFLTYPQCGDLTSARLCEYLRDTRGAAWYCVGLEQHEDGGNHLHAYAEWLHRLDVREATYFDVDGQHPNIQSVRNKTHVLKYVQKAGDYVGNCEVPSSTTVGYGDLIRQSGGVREFLEGVVQQHPRDAVLHWQRIQEFARDRWPEERAEYVPAFTEFAEPAILKQWRDEEFIKVIGNPWAAYTAAGLGSNPSARVFDVRPKHMGLTCSLTLTCLDRSTPIMCCHLPEPFWQDRMGKISRQAHVLLRTVQP